MVANHFQLADLRVAAPSNPQALSTVETRPQPKKTICYRSTSKAVGSIPASRLNKIHQDQIPCHLPKASRLTSLAYIPN